jgi:hypothetical protein
VWDAATGKEIAVLRGHESYVSPDIKMVSKIFDGE